MHDAEIEAVSFDLDDTLCAYHRPPGEVLAAAFRRADVAPFFTDDEYVATFDRLVEGADDMATLRRRAFARLARETDRDPAVGHAVAEAYTDLRRPDAVGWCDGARALFERVATRYPVAIVTNGFERTQRAKLAAIGIVDAVDVAVFAGDGVAPKPDPAPFHRALDELDVPPERAIHVGNSLAHDVAGAKAAGMRAAWLARRDEPVDGGVEADVIVDAPGSLLPLPWEG